MALWGGTWGGGGGGGSGDIEGVTAGEGIAGGGTSGTVTVSLARPSASFYWLNDFITDKDLTAPVAGSGTSANIPGEAGHPGIWRLSTTSVATNAATVRTLLDCLVVGGGPITFESVARGVDAAPDGTDTYVARIGGGDVVNAEWTDGIGFRVTSASPNWFAVARGASTETATDTTIAYSAGAWVRFGWVLNAAGTSVDYLINGSVVATIATANVPTGAEAFGPLASIVKSVGTAARRFDVDYLYIRQDFTTPR